MGGSKKRKSNKGKAVPPTPTQEKTEDKKGGLRTPSPTPTSGGRFGGLTVEEDRELSIVDSEDEEEDDDCASLLER